MQVIFNPQIYTKQPAVLTVKEWGDEAYWLKVVVRTAPSVTVWYRLPLNESEFSANLIEIIRMLFETASSYNVLEVSTYDEYKSAVIDSVQTIQFYRAGTIDPTKILRPFDLSNLVQLEDTMDSLKSYYPLVMPTVMLRGESIARVVVEMWRESLTSFLDNSYYLYGTNDEPLNVATKNLTIPLSDESWNDTHFNIEEDCILFVLHGDSGYTITKMNMQPQECDKLYAAVEWVSQYGVTRRHIFEVIKQTAAVDGVISIETIDNGWDERKGSVHGCTLRLEELNRYDYWYYADLILADTAKITFDGVNWYTLQVTAKNYTLPNSDSGQLSTLEIPINYCRYDTI